MNYEEAYEHAKNKVLTSVENIRGLNVFEKGRVTWYTWCEGLIFAFEEGGVNRTAMVHYPHFEKQKTYKVEQSTDSHYSHILRDGEKTIFYGTICPDGERLCECDHCIHQNRQMKLVNCWNYRYEIV